MSISTQKKEQYEIVNKKCAGIDVHRDFVNVTVVIENEEKDIFTSYQVFSTTKESLLQMRDWLLGYGCTIAGMESTGKYWYPVYFALEEHMQVNVYNARNMRNMPGKKTDKIDSEWIAKVTRHALIRPSFIPEPRIRDARLFSRERKSLVKERSSVRQRILGILDSAGIKLSSVISDVFGVSGRILLQDLLKGRQLTPEYLKKRVYGNLKDKVDDIMAAVDGYLRETHITLLKILVMHEQSLTESIEKIEKMLTEFLIDSDQSRAVLARIITIPGFSERSGTLLLAEVGFDLKAFPTNKQFCSWLGLAPGKKESAGKNVSGKIQVRQRYLRALLIEIALASTRLKGTYVRAKYWILKGRIGGKKAVVAIAHYLAKAVYRAIYEEKEFVELTEAYSSMRQTRNDFKLLDKIKQRQGLDSMFAYLSQNPENEPNS